MLLTITTMHRPAIDLGYLLHKHPERFQSYDLSFGRAHVFYPEATDGLCTAGLLLDVDPVGMVWGKVYRDRRLGGYDAASVMEVVEHLEPPRLAAFERAVFEFARPGTVVLTTPNREYDITWENVGAGKLRHPNHRFEWARAEFRAWAGRVTGRHGYAVRFLPVGPVDEGLGPPTQMGVFGREGVGHG